MDDKSRNPRKPGGVGAPADAKASTSGTPPTGADEETQEAPAVERWEEEGGIIVEPDPGGVAAPVEAAPDYKDRWLRAEAELQNFRRRSVRDREEGRRAAEEAVLLEVVAALDDLDRALESARSSGAPGTWLDGVALVAQRLHESLARRGVTVDDPVGRPFDPAFHEAMLEVDAPPGTAPGTVVQVSHKGYRRDGRALRPARVVVARAPGGSSG
jgi:molecular chaperone GrpE